MKKGNFRDLAKFGNLGRMAACSSLALTIPLTGCGVLASNGIDYSSYPIPALPAAPAPAAPPPASSCQMPESGQPVSLEGCKTGDTLVLRGVNFEFNKATLTVNAKALLDQVAEALASHTDIKVEVGGHTDVKGSDVYNQKLSENRAKAVKSYLVAHSVAADRLSIKGYGKTVPIADNATDEGRELNRRVELKVLESPAPVVAAAPAAPTPAQKNNGLVILEPLAAHAAEPGAGIPTSIGVLTHVPNPVEAGPTPNYLNATGTAPPALGPGPDWQNHTGGPTYAPPAAAALAGNTVAISNFKFVPATLSVSPGTTVTWTNKDAATHTVEFPDQNQTLGTGASFNRTFSKPGTYTYQCGIHASMSGKVVVQ